MASSAISTYLAKLQHEFASGKAGEHSYRPALKELIEMLGNPATAKQPELQAINEPAHIECGAPDYVVQRKELPLGYVEAKDIGVSLDEFEKSNQFRRYNNALTNLITTDYLEFRHFVEGTLRASVRLGSVVKGKIKPDPAQYSQAIALFTGFFAQQPQRIEKASLLVKRMAEIAHLLREAIEKALASDISNKTESRFTEQYESFRRVLIADLSHAKFADMYAQTLAYGTFAARLEQPTGEFDRQKAVFNVPKSNPLLCEVFDDFAGAKADSRIIWLLDDLLLLLQHADLEKILDEWDYLKQGEDWVYHFYQHFLAAYDPDTRQKLGVYYTPQPVIRYIVSAIDSVLKKHFGLPQGLADKGQAAGGHRVQILDPACGSGSFIFGVVDHIRQQFDVQQRAGQWPGYVHDHLLPRLFGFEIQMAPYTVAHIKLGRQLADSGFHFGGHERVNIYLTNTLEDPEHGQQDMFIRNEMVREAEAARRVKRERPILVVLGNPPYSGHSENPSEMLVNGNGGKGKKVKTFIGNLIQDYFYVDGQPLGERNPKWLQDDYVKFLRWAQWRIDRTGQGVLAMITNHGYLDNPTFRGMRQRLMQSFDLIYVLDLHGNDRKKERVPEDVQQAQGIGPGDKNVFDIQQGVTICVMVKLPVALKESARVFHADLWGLRPHKYAWLNQAADSGDSLKATAWQELDPRAPAYLFVPQDDELREEYEAGWSITRLVKQHSVGLATGHDKEVIAFKRSDALGLAQDLNVDSSRVKEILYRPFDLRFIVYDKSCVTRPREQLLNHLLVGENAAIITSRLTKGEMFNHVQASSWLAEVICMSPKTSNNGFVFPYYLYPISSADPRTDAPGGRRPNLSPEFIAACEKAWKLKFVSNGVGDLKATFGPEDVFHYMYAVFHSPEYRRRYAEFLKRDFPRLPILTVGRASVPATAKTAARDGRPTGMKLLRELCALGAKLTQIHLMNPSAVDTAKFKLPGYPVSPTPAAPPAKGALLASGQTDMNLHSGGGGDIVEKVEYKPPTDKLAGRVWINKFQYFEGVTPEVWDFRVGGYQPCEKWLKDRKGRKLSDDDKDHYRLIVAILAQTRALMQEIDAAITKSGGWPLK